MCCLHNFDDASCDLHNPTSFSRRTPTTINDLPEDVVSQILVRLPPHPTCLLAASGTKKAWRQCMGSNYFRKLTVSHNGGNPLLGFFTNNSEDNRFITEHDLHRPSCRSWQSRLNRTVPKSMSWDAVMVWCYSILQYHTEGI